MATTSIPDAPATRGLLRRGLCGAALAALGTACGGSGGPDVVRVARDLASVTPDPLTAAAESAPGDFAADYLRSTHFDTLLVEVDYPVSRPPTPEALVLLEQRLGERCDKPGGVFVLLDDAIPDAAFPAAATLGDLADLEGTWRDTWSDAGTRTAVAYALYALGEIDLGGGPETVLGLTYAGGSTAMFVEAADQGGDVLVTTEEVEATGLVHEFGHLVGLVNEGVPMVTPHEDEDQRAHDESAACVMYWLLQVPLVAPNLGDPDFARYDLRCREDVAAFGGLPVGLPLVAAARPAEAADPRRVLVGVCPNCRGRGLVRR